LSFSPTFPWVRLGLHIEMMGVVQVRLVTGVPSQMNVDVVPRYIPYAQPFEVVKVVACCVFLCDSAGGTVF